MPTPQTTLQLLWLTSQLPPSSLSRISAPTASVNGGELLPTSFNLTTAAQAVIAASAGLAAEILRLRKNEKEASHVAVEGRDAINEFRSEMFARLDGQVGKVWDDLVGQYKSGPEANNWLRPHTNFPHHRQGLLHELGLPSTTTKEQLAEKLLKLNAHETADRFSEKGLCMTSLRGFTDWDLHEQGQVASDKGGGPIPLYKLNDRPPKPFTEMTEEDRRPLRGVKVLDLTRIIAGPTAGRTLASTSKTRRAQSSSTRADVIPRVLPQRMVLTCYGVSRANHSSFKRARCPDSHRYPVNAPQNPKLPGLDFDTSRSKRSIQLDLSRSNTKDRATFEELLKSADVLLQAYRPSALSSLGYSLEDCLSINPDLIYASLSAWGEEGPWSHRKGFDSLVQFAVGFNEAEGRAFEKFESGQEVAEGEGKEPRKLPAQALDHSSGYLLAFGVQAALYHRATTGGAYYVENSLLSTATWVRGLGRAPLSSFGNKLESFEQVKKRGGIGETIGFEGKKVEFIRHSARFEGGIELVEQGGSFGYDSDDPKWLENRA